MTTDGTLTQQDVVEKLRDAELVMLTTALPDGKLLSHPMSIQGVSEDADVWFFVSLSGGQAEALRSGPEVNLAVAQAGSWLSLAGRAAFVEDPALVDQLWTDSAESYFPGGTEDPDLGLLRVSGDSAQYWGMPGGRVAGLARIVKAKMAGEQAPGGTGTTEL